MEQVKMVTYRYLTDADFYNMYKPLDSEQGGGGQKYIDFGTASVSVADWNEFFDGVEGLVKPNLIDSTANQHIRSCSIILF